MLDLVYLQINCIFLKLSQCLRGPSQPHLCFCLHARIWLLYFIRSLLKQRQITVKLLRIIKLTFRNTPYSKLEQEFASPCYIHNFDVIDNGGG